MLIVSPCSLLPTVFVTERGAEPRPATWHASVTVATELVEAAAAVLQQGGPTTDLVALSTELTASVNAALVSFGRDFGLFRSKRLTKAPELDRLAALLDIADSYNAAGSSAFAVQAKAEYARGRDAREQVVEAVAQEWTAQIAALPPYRVDEPSEITRRRLELASNWIAVSTVIPKSDEVLFDSIVGTLPLHTDQLVGKDTDSPLGPSPALLAALGAMESALVELKPHVEAYLKLYESDPEHKAAYAYSNEHLRPLAPKLLDPFTDAMRVLPPFHVLETNTLTTARLRMLQIANFARRGHLHDDHLRRVEDVSRNLQEAGELRVSHFDMASPEFPYPLLGAVKTLEALGFRHEGATEQSQVGTYHYDSATKELRIGSNAFRTLAELDAFLERDRHLSKPGEGDPRAERLVAAGVAADAIHRMGNGSTVRVREDRDRVSIIATDTDLVLHENHLHMERQREEANRAPSA